MYKPFIEEIIERYKLPWKFFAFNSYFIIIVIGFGGLGVFVKICEIFSSTTPGYDVAKDMATYSVAIIAASLVDLNLSLNIQSKPSLTINSFAVGAISILLMYLSYNINSYWALLPGLLGILIALSVWILANADNENLSDSIYYEKMRGKDIGHGKNWK